MFNHISITFQLAANIRIEVFLFKNEIIKNFRKYTPDGILKGFKDDNDIWDYINEMIEDEKEIREREEKEE